MPNQVTISITDSELVATVPGRENPITLNLALDLPSMLELMEHAEAMEAPDGGINLSVMRKLIPAALLEADPPLDGEIGLQIMMRWLDAVGTRVGKALTPQPA